MNKTIQLHGFSKNDEMVFTSLLSLLSNKTQYQWDVVQNRSAEVVIIDIDNESDVSVIQHFERSGHKVITYGQPSVQQPPLQLQKPMRAAAILRCLAQVSVHATTPSDVPAESIVYTVPPETPTIKADTATVAEEPSVEPSTPVGISLSYRLKRWPDSSVLKATPGATRICAIMLRQVLSVEEIAELGGLAVANVREFIGNCDQKGYLDIKQRVSQINRPPITPKSKINPILAKLRLKFGARV